ncbi:MAG TPA: cytochrome P450 [Solirubrobacteraceae bacterium]|jgi:cytochrome P450|nr:cytochrome P450 [Solirubrobacteraceae bacterium]
MAASPTVPATQTDAATSAPAPGAVDAQAGGSEATPAAPARSVGARHGLPPGPRAPSLLQTLAWSVAPTWVMDNCAKRLGESFTLTFWPSGMKLVMVSGPEAVKTVFTAPPDVAPSAAGNSPIRPVMGPSSVIVLTGAEHMRQRKLLLPPFHGERMREYESTIVDATRKDMATWQLGRPMRLQEHTRAITLEVILRAVFGVEAERMDALRTAIAGLLAPMRPWRMVLLALRMPSVERPGGAIGDALDHLNAVIYEELAKRRAQTDLAERTDILSLLLQARDEDGQPMTDAELRDELVTLLLAGHETTATSVAWAIERLVRHPDKLARLVAEIDAGDVAGDGYMTAVINETLRVRPVVPIVARMLQRELEVDGYTLPQGTRVTPSIYLTNRNARVYDEPQRFQPERFERDAPETFSWIPFGGGIRRCIGASFAQLEMKLMLRTMLAELTPSVADERRWRPGRRDQMRDELNRRRAITLVPARGARVMWSRR